MVYLFAFIIALSWALPIAWVSAVAIDWLSDVLANAIAWVIWMCGRPSRRAYARRKRQWESVQPVKGDVPFR